MENTSLLIKLDNLISVLDETIIKAMDYIETQNKNIDDMIFQADESKSLKNQYKYRLYRKMVYILAADIAEIITNAYKIIEESTNVLEAAISIPKNSSNEILEEQISLMSKAINNINEEMMKFEQIKNKSIQKQESETYTLYKYLKYKHKYLKLKIN